METQNMVIKMSEKNLLGLYKYMNFSLGKGSCIEFCTKKEKKLPTGVWKLRGLRWKTYKGTCCCV